MMKNVAVTGGSGGAGAYVIAELLEHGYQVLNLDRVPPRDAVCPYREVEMTDYAQVVSALDGRDAVISFASDPEPDFDFDTGADRFRNNTLCTYNVFNAACALGLSKVVWASSETVLGFPFETSRPRSVPVDESHPPLPQNSYAISKVLCEEAAVYLNRLHGVPFIGLRLSNVLYEGDRHRDVYSEIPGYWQDLNSRRGNLWSYIDARDAARCARLALESAITGSENFIIAADDTIMRQTNLELLEAVYPEVPVSRELGYHQSMISNGKAWEILGWKPRYSWRDVIDRPAN